MHGTSRYGLVVLLCAVGLGALMASPARAATFVYVGNTDSNEIYVLQLDRQSGDLALVEKVPIPGVTKVGNSTPMAVSPSPWRAASAPSRSPAGSVPIRRPGPM